MWGLWRAGGGRHGGPGSTDVAGQLRAPPLPPPPLAPRMLRLFSGLFAQHEAPRLTMEEEENRMKKEAIIAGGRSEHAKLFESLTSFSKA